MTDTEKDAEATAAVHALDFEKAERGLIGEDLVLPKYKKYLEGLESRDKAQAGAQPPAKSIAFDLETLSPKGLVAPPPGKSAAEILADVQKKMGTDFTDYVSNPATSRGIKVAIPADTCNGCEGPFNEYRKVVFGGPGFEMCGDCATKDGYRDTTGTIDERIKEAQPPEEPEVKGAWATPTWEEDYG